ncbi:class I SAM-dependent methyltransferase [Streptomyces sp. NPDC049555]|uniref:class I SAM-dependent methyltransferase n=1 Tax=Streptomyces sp. NPDC049555 TaxID=3154930 RepID=UPI0034360649
MTIDDPAAYWDLLWAGGTRYRAVDETELAALKQHAGHGAGRTALDVGSGDGALARHLAHLGYTTTGIDCSLAAISLATENSTTSGVTFHVADIEAPGPLPVAEGAVHLITARLVFAFITDKSAFLERVRHLLTPDGLFWVVTPMADRLPEDRAWVGITTGDKDLLTTGWSAVHTTDIDTMRCYALRP